MNDYRVSVDEETLQPYLRDALTEYLDCTPDSPPCCFAVLLGHLSDGQCTVRDIKYGANVKSSEGQACAEFDEVIVPCFGKGYAHQRRGFWCDSKDLLRIYREANDEGLDILGSIHLHPDWHVIGPEGERALRIGQWPTPMDNHMFVNTQWPVNMICYIQGTGSGPRATVAAWSTSEEKGATMPLTLDWRGWDGAERSSNEIDFEMMAVR
ncbi:hypothetical protein AB0N05_01895 [Nocardia sp. NPDC051030]|uniref:hypothetical protein n=1 Tax=Nocardia sp. NPDC051030 TaxID=3155162 RepID=UPI00342F0B40